MGDDRGGILERLIWIIQQCLDSDDCGPALGAEVLTDAVKLMSLAARHGLADVEAISTVAWLHLIRAERLPQEGETALRLSALLSTHAPELVRPQAAEWLEDNPGLLTETTSPYRVYAPVAAAHALGTEELALLDLAIAMTRKAAAQSGDDEAEQAGHRLMLGIAMVARHPQVGEAGELAEAIELLRSVLAMLPADHPGRAGGLAVLAGALQHRFEESGGLPDLEESLKAGWDSVDALAHDVPDRYAPLVTLCNGLRMRFGLSRDRADIQQSVQCGREAAALVSHDQPERGMVLASYGLALVVAHASAEGEPGTTLDEAVQQLREAVRLVPAGHPYRLVCLNSLALAHLMLAAEHEDSNVDTTQLDAAVQTAGTAINTFTPHHSGYGQALYTLGNALWARFRHAGNSADLHQAASALSRASVLLPAWSPIHRTCLSIFDAVMRARLERIAEVGDRLRAVRASLAAAAGHPTRPALLAHAAETVLSRGQPADLEEAAKWWREAVELTPPTDPKHASYLCDLAVPILRRAELTHDGASLEASIATSRRAAAMACAEPSTRARALVNLAVALRIRSLETRSLDDLAEAIEAGVAAIAADDGRPLRPRLLLGLGMSLLMWFERTGSQPELAKAVDSFAEALAAVPEGHPDRAAFLAGLGGALGTRYGLAGDAGDLAAAIDLLDEAVALTPAEHPELAARLSQAGAARAQRYQRAGDLHDLTEAMGLGRRAIAASPRQHVQRRVALMLLCTALQASYLRSGDPEELAEAIDVVRQMRESRFTAGIDPALVEAQLTRLLLLRFERTQESTDLAELVEVAAQAVAAPAANPHYRAGDLSNYGNALRARYTRFGNTADLEAAVQAHRQAVAVRPQGHAERALLLMELGLAEHARYLRTGHPGDFETAIGTLRSALDACPAGHPDRAGYLGTLGSLLLHKFERSGLLADLNDGVQTLRSAVEGMSSHDPRRLVHLSNLGNALRARLVYVGSAHDLADALSALQECVAAAAPGNPNRGVYLSNLAALWLSRYQQSRSSADLRQAVEAARAAVELSPPDHPQRVILLLNLGGLLVTSASAGVTDHMDEAITMLREAVHAAGEDNSAKAMAIANLANALTARHERHGRKTDAVEAIQQFELAVAILGEEHTYRANALLGLGNALGSRYRKSLAEDDFSGAVGALRRAVGTPAAPRWVCARAGQLWGLLAAQRQDWGQARQGFSAAVALLPGVAWHGIGRRTREERLRDWDGLAGVAAACSLNDRRPTEAVEVLEQGRSVLWAQLLQIRDDFASLRERDADMHVRLTKLALALDSDTALDRPGASPPSTTGPFAVVPGGVSRFIDLA